jgi:hypothetical protein
MTDKTIADVLDKSIDKLSGGAAEVAKTIKSMAPHAWEVAVRQQVVEGVTSLVVMAAAIACALLFYRLLGAKMNERDKPIYQVAYLSDLAMALRIVFVALLVGVLVSIGCAIHGAKRLANPEYYAAMAILGAVK